MSINDKGNLVVDFPTWRDLGSPYRFELREGIGLHQLAILDMPYDLNIGTPDHLTPVSVKWKADGQSPYRTFYGYVNHNESVLPHGGAALNRIYLIGTSRPMNNPDPNSWVNMTGSFIAKQVSTKYGFRCILHNSKILMPFWTSSINSDFQMMSELAEYYGYFFWVDGATLHFLDPLVLLQSANLNEVTVLNKNNTSGDDVLEIVSHKGPLSGVTDHATIQTVYGIDQATGRFIKTTSSGLNSQTQLPTSPDLTIAPRSVNSLALAQRTNQASVGRGTWSTIEAVIHGRTMGIGDLIELVGGSVSDEDKGIWLVDGATHIISFNEEADESATYHIELHARRNTQVGNTFRTTTRLTNAVKTVDAVLRKNTVWESSTLESVYV